LCPLGRQPHLVPWLRGQGNQHPARAVFPTPRLRAKGGTISSRLHPTQGGPLRAVAAVLMARQYLPEACGVAAFVERCRGFCWAWFQFRYRFEVILVSSRILEAAAPGFTGFG
jgi:hypothetical protein